jgi:hypothetical protein
MIQLHCRKCGEPFTPSREDMVKGPEVYRLCKPCREMRKEEPDAADQPLR